MVKQPTEIRQIGEVGHKKFISEITQSAVGTTLFTTLLLFLVLGTGVIGLLTILKSFNPIYWIGGVILAMFAWRRLS